MPRSHLTVLASSASLYPTLPAFRVPTLDQQTNAVLEWRTITYNDFYCDVERFARYWLRRLRASGIPHRSVIGMWLGGQTYLDVLHVYGLARAGYIPQLFSLRLPNPEVIYKLMEDAHASALIYDMATTCSLAESPVPSFVAVPSHDIADGDEELPSIHEDFGADDIFSIFHTR
jgi:acyl-CoA synthetase (AMP-forming)/AMP-acid ligase II